MLESARRAVVGSQRFIQLPRNNPSHPTNSGEKKKAIIRKSFWIALRRCGVHVVPILFTITILLLNFEVYYIGTSFSSLIKSETINLLLLQVAAKIQELLIVSSLATVIFHVARNELLFGDGLPLGLIGSGLLFSNFGYFFSGEFFGSLSYKGNWRRKVAFLVTLVIAGLTAMLAGPSTAVLIVPRNQHVNAGGTSFYIKGGTNDLWPLQLDGNATGNLPYCNDSNSTKYAICPGGGFQSLWAHFGQADFSNFRTGTTSRSYSKQLSGSPFYWAIDSPLSMTPRVYTLGQPRVEGKAEVGTFLVQPHAATATLLQQITMDWWEALLHKRRRSADSIDDRVAKSTGRNPVTQIRCTPPQNVSKAGREVEFPVMTPPVQWRGNANLTVFSPNINASDHLRFQWVHLPGWFGPASIGALFESPWASDNSSRVAIGCTLQSLWVNATLYTDEYSFWSGWYPWDIQFDKQYPTWDPGSVAATNGRIAATDAWLQMLTPPTPAEGPGYYPWKPTTIESILMNTGFSSALVPEGNLTMAADWRKGDLAGVSRTALLEAIICSVFEDGLSRVGSHLVYNTSGSTSQWKLSTYDPKTNFNESILNSKDAFNPPDLPPQGVTKLRIDMEITGFAFKGSLAAYLSMSVLLIHVVFALVHTTWMLTRKNTSDSWDSISKIVALAQNSKPAFEALHNTSAGIDRFRTFGHVAKIRVTEIPDSGDADHVELIFEKSSEQIVECSETPLEVEDTETTRFHNQPKFASTWPSYAHGGSTTLTVSRASSIRGAKNSVASLLPPHGYSTSANIENIVQVDQKYG